jgi:thiamine-monophosphate kinase
MATAWIFRTKVDSEEIAQPDEPIRLEQTVVPTFANETTDWITSLDNTATAQLIAGVLAQDDCAVFHLEGAQDLVLGSDYIRGPKFRLYELGYLNNFDIGYYLATANFSDVAAMGAQPIALLSVVRYPKSMPLNEFKAVIEGIRSGCDAVGARNVGGDIGTAERLILSAAAIGTVEPGQALYRIGAVEGDILCVTGYTGVAGAAQQYLYSLDGKSCTLPGGIEDILLQSWKRPTALIKQGRVMSRSKIVTSCQDSSDGLKAAIESLATASKVGFLVYEADLPIAPVVRAVAAGLNIQELDLIFGDSVDFQLVFTVAPQNIAALQKEFGRSELAFFPIGVATRSSEVTLHRRDGTNGALPGEAWRHAIE